MNVFSVLAKELVNNSKNSIPKRHINQCLIGVLKRLSGWKFDQSQPVVMLKLTHFFETPYSVIRRITFILHHIQVYLYTSLYTSAFKTNDKTLVRMSLW